MTAYAYLLVAVAKFTDPSVPNVLVAVMFVALAWHAETEAGR